MIKILIADDEPFIRQGIRTTIPWEKHGIEIVGEAANGKSALKLAMQLSPDIVIADISMPVMSGLELASQLNELRPDIRVIILSAYGTTDNFTGAFKSKVSRFVLKSADSSIILDNVLQVKEEICNDRQINRSYERLSNIYSENQHLIKSTLFCRYLQNQITPEAFSEKAAKVGVTLQGPYYTMLLAECKPGNDWLTILALQSTFAAYSPFAFFIEENLLLLLLNTEKQGITNENLKLVFPEIKPYILGNRLACMNEMKALEEFSISYSSLCSRLNDCFWNSEWDYSIITQTYTFSSSSKNNTLRLEKDIISAVLCQNIILADQAVNRYYDYCKAQALPQKEFLDSVKRLLLLLSSINPLDTDIDTLVSSVCGLESPEEILEALKSLINPPNTQDSQKPQITAALNFMYENYDKDLRLEDVAQQICLSVGYLSRIFKTETGYSFTECLHRIRIEKAKELILHTNLKYYEIAEKVGYKDYKYFSAYFNKLCGCSAKEYKNKGIQMPSCSINPDSQPGG